MSGSATTYNNVKRLRVDGEDTNSGSAAIGGSATNNKNAGNINNVTKIVTLLRAALMSQSVGLESLPEVSLPFLKLSLEKLLCEFTIHYYLVECWVESRRKTRFGRESSQIFL